MLSVSAKVSDTTKQIFDNHSQNDLVDQEKSSKSCLLSLQRRADDTQEASNQSQMKQQNTWNAYEFSSSSSNEGCDVREENPETQSMAAGQKKQYSVTTDDSRKRFIELWNSGTITIKQAAQACGINYSTAKSIVKLSKMEGRIEKKKKRISKRMRREKEELENLLHSSLKRQKVELPSLDQRQSEPPQFLQQLGILPTGQDPKEKQLVEKACSNQLVGLTSDFLNFSQHIQMNLSKQDTIIPKSILENNSFLLEKEVQTNSLSAIELRNLSLNQLQQFQEIVKLNQNNSTRQQEQRSCFVESCDLGLNKRRNILFEVLIEKTLDEKIGLEKKGYSFLHSLYI